MASDFSDTCLGLIPGLLTPMQTLFPYFCNSTRVKCCQLGLLMTPLSVGKKRYNFTLFGALFGPSETNWWTSLCFRKPACMLSAAGMWRGLLTVQIQTKRACYFVVSTCITQMAGSSFGDQNMKSSRDHFSISALWGTEVISPCSQRGKNVLCQHCIGKSAAHF